MEPEAYLQERGVEKEAAIAAVAKALDAIEAQRREPDEWERFHLAHAFVMIFNGIYRAAPADVELALQKPAERSRVTIPSVFGDCGLGVLREVLRAVGAEPVRPFPHLGPVKLGGPETGA